MSSEIVSELTHLQKRIDLVANSLSQILEELDGLSDGLSVAIARINNEGVISLDEYLQRRNDREAS